MRGLPNPAPTRGLEKSQKGLRKLALAGGCTAFLVCSVPRDTAVHLTAVCKT